MSQTSPTVETRSECLTRRTLSGQSEGAIRKEKRVLQLRLGPSVLQGGRSPTNQRAPLRSVFYSNHEKGERKKRRTVTREVGDALAVGVLGVGQREEALENGFLVERQAAPVDQLPDEGVETAVVARRQIQRRFGHRRPSFPQQQQQHHQQQQSKT